MSIAKYIKNAVLCKCFYATQKFIFKHTAALQSSKGDLILKLCFFFIF